MQQQPMAAPDENGRWPAPTMACAVARAGDWAQLVTTSRRLQQAASSVHVILTNDIALQVGTRSAPLPRRGVHTGGRPVALCSQACWGSGWAQFLKGVLRLVGGGCPRRAGGFFHGPHDGPGGHGGCVPPHAGGAAAIPGGVHVHEAGPALCRGARCRGSSRGESGSGRSTGSGRRCGRGHGVARPAAAAGQCAAGAGVEDQATVAVERTAVQQLGRQRGKRAAAMRGGAEACAAS